MSKGFLNILFFITLLSSVTISLSADTSKYHCLDNRDVDKIEDCDTEDYRAFIKKTLGEDYLCDTEQSGGKLFKCPNNSKCVAHTKDCGCPTSTTNWNGFCYPTNNNPIKKIDSNKITCVAKIKINNHDQEAVRCGDGTCRQYENECNT